MFVLRPITQRDFSELKDIAIASGHGFTSLPVDDNVLCNKITRTEQSVARDIQQAFDETYLFVLEDTDTNRIVGTSGIEAAVGTHIPIYHYHIGKTVHYSRTLDVYNAVEVLSMCNDYTGSSEICTLYLRPEYRRSQLGRFLSRARFLFMAQHPQRFSERVIAEMRGHQDEEGNSPFWQWLQEHFFSIEFPHADRLVGLGNKEFISELMPKYPIYANLLSSDAQEVIGKVHKDTLPALKLLEKEGFENRGYVDLFDAGPTVECKFDQIDGVKQSKTAKVSIQSTEPSAIVYAICNQHTEGFRATFTNNMSFDEESGIVNISPEVAEQLNVFNQDEVRFFVL
ncbi:arginine N-succinyltransferase [Bermanella marisrubri]|uniref:Arginine N-succinyltransferase n=1 Tax=Bermanella marisrubri TaxID=207949 RepID=Q1MZU9_9GAMM|nr:arginine N-succinyltransferase [Bermanella marisrubri]EAT11458.1 putative arginine succinyltransferase [Oceanobacter sp. RED65] [Bermanella marisrubri]QIZ85036.1 arginine N-succinyltransferase [Bermanella marisrubri]